MSDYIDRQAAIDAISEACFELRGVFGSCEDALNALPSAEVEPVKHGRWKPFDLTWGRSVYACTSCGEAFEVPTEMEKPIFIYCPNCGARMNTEEEHSMEEFMFGQDMGSEEDGSLQ